MDYSIKKATPSVSFGRRGPTVTPRAPNHDGTSTHSCNRLGCSTRYNSMKGVETSSVEKLKSSSSKSFNSRSRAMVSSPSRVASSSTSIIRKSKEQKSQLSQSRQVTNECSGFLELIDDASSCCPESDGLVGTSQDGSDTSVSSSVGSCPNIKKPIQRRNQGTSSFASSVRQTASNVQTIRPSQRQCSSNSQRYRLRNLGCSSMSDVLPPGSASTSLNSGTRSLTRSYTSQGSSSSRGQSRKGSVEEHSTSQQTRPSRSQPTSRTTGSRRASSTTVVASARLGRGSGVEGLRTGVHENDMFLLPDPVQSPPTQSSSVGIESVRSSHSNALLRGSAPHRQGRSEAAQSLRSAHARPSSQLSDRSRRGLAGRLADRSGYQQFNMGGVAEVLLALEQIEQDTDLSYEQLLLLETNLLLGGLGIPDRHREMRLDIDNMSYEELLALGEHIGTVATALSEEEVSKCLNRGIYDSSSIMPNTSDDSDDDVKCCICQEEYASGDEVAKLSGCGHLYHTACVQQWFRLKNWCPICKSPASSS